MLDNVKFACGAAAALSLVWVGWSRSRDGEEMGPPLPRFGMGLVSAKLDGDMIRAEFVVRNRENIPITIVFDDARVSWSRPTDDAIRHPSKLHALYDVPQKSVPKAATISANTTVTLPIEIKSSKPLEHPKGSQLLFTLSARAEVKGFRDEVDSTMPLEVANP